MTLDEALWLARSNNRDLTQFALDVVKQREAVGEARTHLYPRFADAGFAALIFDFRNLGESEGTPRGQIFAEDQQEDYRNAITWLQLQSQIDPERIGVWGFSFSGGHVLQVAAFDRRIKCVVAQVPAPVETQFSRRSHDRL